MLTKEKNPTISYPTFVESLVLLSACKMLYDAFTPDELIIRWCEGKSLFLMRMSGQSSEKRLGEGGEWQCSP